MKYSCVPGVSVAIMHIARAVQDCVLRRAGWGMLWKRGSRGKEKGSLTPVAPVSHSNIFYLVGLFSSSDCI